MERAQCRKLLSLTLVFLLLTSSWLVTDAQIRLAGGTRCSGRVEIFHNNQWGTVCDDEWDIKDARVVCRELHCGTAAAAKSGAHFGQGSDPIWLDEVRCSGHENSLVQCSHSSFGSHNCKHAEDAGVICSGVRIRLAGGTRCSGRVEIFHSGQWGTVCDDSWDLNDARVVCRELRCGTAEEAKTEAHFGVGSGKIWLDEVACSGHENSLVQCSHPSLGIHNCGHSEDAGVICSNAQIRLAGPTRCAGRVEILHNNHWGTVCDDEWDIKDARVVCRELVCGTAREAKSGAHFGPGSGVIWLDNVACSGDENSLFQCSHPNFGTHNCGHSEDAGVICSGPLPTPRLLPTSLALQPGEDSTLKCSLSSGFNIPVKISFYKDGVSRKDQTISAQQTLGVMDLSNTDSTHQGK
ncbi:scavenger receptor cysteine-rich domain-containing protein DMBT1-like [Genypterus blacodes]|uniref:scavenger receptor cysteine-rich domain-containing protein DMBT1-like n=1 Tax=Genypterus blacodes TaxID=154954 RepID=UPI003F758E9A